jgi:DNA repair exonuclease SbcCD ATPase subunit
MEQSGTYVNNKVVKIEWIEKFYSNVKDSLESAKYEISNLEKTYSEEKKVSKEALKSVTVLKKELKSVNAEKENITLFGSLTSKSSYKTIVWIIIISLLTFLLFFLFKFQSSNRVTKEAKEKLKEIEFELEETKKKSRIKEQELMRKLQDEINKNS